MNTATAKNPTRPRRRGYPRATNPDRTTTNSLILVNRRREGGTSTTVASPRGAAVQPARTKLRLTKVSAEIFVTSLFAEQISICNGFVRRTNMAL